MESSTGLPKTTTFRHVDVSRLQGHMSTTYSGLSPIVTTTAVATNHSRPPRMPSLTRYRTPASGTGSGSFLRPWTSFPTTFTRSEPIARLVIKDIERIWEHLSWRRGIILPNDVPSTAEE
jgi:hypothetical protein